MSASLPAFLAEARANFRLALPLIVAQLSFVSMGTVDTILAGRLGAAPLAAIAVGTNIWFLVFVLFMGVAMAVSPIVAQRLGARQAPFLIGRFLADSLWLALLLGLLWWLLLRLAREPILHLLNLDAQTLTYARDYLHAVNWATVPFALGFFLRNGAEGHGLTRVPLLAGLTGFAVNGLSAWALMYGKWGLPALGPAGCGWAAVIAAWAMVGVYALQYRYTQALHALALLRHGWRPRLDRETREVLRVGLPIAAIVTAESTLFSAGALMMARFGTDAVAAHQIAINFASLAFMVPLSIGMATTVRVGHAAGAGDAAAVILRGRAGIAMGVCFALLSATLMSLLPGAIVGLYTGVEGIASAAIGFLGFAAVFQIFDCIQATSSGALRGIKDTRLPMIITLFGYWGVGLPVAVWLAFRTPVGPVGIWWGFIAGLAVAAAGLSTRFHRRTRAPSPRRVPLLKS